MKNLIALFFIIGLFSSFTLVDNPKIKITQSNVALENTEFPLEEGTYLLHSSCFENFYVSVKSRHAKGKQYNKETYKRERIEGTEFVLTFFTQCNQKGTRLEKEKTFVTVWNNGKISKWNTERPFTISDYTIEIEPFK